VFSRLTASGAGSGPGGGLDVQVREILDTQRDEMPAGAEVALRRDGWPVARHAEGKDGFCRRSVPPRSRTPRGVQGGADLAAHAAEGQL
jgi:hypothetical protein